MLSHIGALKNNLFHRPLFFQIHLVSPHWKTKDSLALIKTTADVFVISIVIVLFKIDWLAYC